MSWDTEADPLSLVGVLTSLLPAFHAECAPARYRGSIVLLDLVMCASGLTLSFWLAYGMSCMLHPSPPVAEAELTLSTQMLTDPLSGAFRSHSKPSSL